jgi:DNA-binding IclR family transcriptional regulator
MVEQVNDRGQYRLGVGNLRLAGATTARLDVVTEAREVCRRLAIETRETVNITVRSDTSALYLDQVAGSSALQSHNWVGQRIPLHATSNGKVLLSELSEDELKAAVVGLPRLTEHTITKRRALKEELEQVRRQGYALAVDELEEGLTAAAAPIRGAHGDIIASMSISGPTFRLTEERLATVVPMLVAAATEVSHRLGWGQRG